MVERKLGVTEARQQLAEIVDQVQHQGDAYLLTRHGKEAVAIVPVAVYNHWKEERQRLFDSIRAIQERNADADPDEVMREVLAAQRAVRQEG